MYFLTFCQQGFFNFWQCYTSHMILYIHGFNSSALSGKAQESKRWLEARGRAEEWVCPDLPHRPAQAIQLLTQIIEKADKPPKLIGSSLGGFYATHLVARYGLKAVLINPAVHAGLLLRPLIGTQQQNWYNNTRYDFTAAHIEELTAIDQLAPAYPNNLLVMLETADETLNWREAHHYYHEAHQLVFQGGDHGFTRFRDVLELIDRF
ncbi:MAG: hypothetical protein RI964_1288 [Pseudomonadota bacterium]|jgi:predicted esterase YcpF (UPF0227 family)